MSKFTKTTKKITDFFTNFDYGHTKLDGNIYQDEDKNYFQLVDIFLNIPKNELGDSKWVTITEKEEYRPDYISFVTYGDERLWWVILQHNGIKDPFELEAGTIIEIPSISTVERYIKIKRDGIKYK